MTNEEYAALHPTSRTLRRGCCVVGELPAEAVETLQTQEAIGLNLARRVEELARFVALPTEMQALAGRMLDIAHGDDRAGRRVVSA